MKEKCITSPIAFSLGPCFFLKAVTAVGSRKVARAMRAPVCVCVMGVCAMDECDLVDNAGH